MKFGACLFKFIFILQTVIIVVVSYLRWGTQPAWIIKRLSNNDITTTGGIENNGTLLPGIKIRQQMEAKLNRSQKLLSWEQARQDDIERLMQNIEDICQKNGSKIAAKSLDYNPYLGLTTYVWMVFPKHNLFYCAVPKCGSTTWKGYLMEDSGLNWEGLDTAEVGKAFRAQAHVKKSNMEPLEWLSTLNHSHKMMIVRNPWARIVSAYEDKIIGRKWNLRINFCSASSKYAKIKPEDITFAVFVDCIILQPHRLGNIHVQPLTELCAVCNVKYNLIVKLEELAVNARFLMKTLNFSSVPDNTPLEHVNSSNSSNSSHSKYYEGLDRKIINRLRAEYQDDIDLFGYPDFPFE